MAQFNLYSDRRVQYPGRFILTNVDDQTAQRYDLERYEGTTYSEGTPFSADIMNRYADEVADAGQDFADILSTDWSSLAVNSNWFSGTIRYKKIGSLVVVYANVYQTGGSGGSTAISGEVDLISSTLPAALRPSASKTGDFRLITGLTNYDGYKPYIEAKTTGKVVCQCNGVNIPATRWLRGEVVYSL